MRLEFYEDTGSLYCHLSAKPSADSQEAAEGVVLDFDAEEPFFGWRISLREPLELNRWEPIPACRVPCLPLPLCPSLGFPDRASIWPNPSSPCFPKSRLPPGGRPVRGKSASAPSRSRRRPGSRILLWPGGW